MVVCAREREKFVTHNREVAAAIGRRRKRLFAVARRMEMWKGRKKVRVAVEMVVGGKDEKINK